MSDKTKELLKFALEQKPNAFKEKFDEIMLGLVVQRTDEMKSDMSAAAFVEGVDPEDEDFDISDEDLDDLDDLDIEDLDDEDLDLLDDEDYEGEYEEEEDLGENFVKKFMKRVDSDVSRARQAGETRDKEAKDKETRDKEAKARK
jgi:hypothetical protein